MDCELRGPTLENHLPKSETFIQRRFSHVKLELSTLVEKPLNYKSSNSFKTRPIKKTTEHALTMRRQQFSIQYISYFQHFEASIYNFNIWIIDSTIKLVGFQFTFNCSVFVKRAFGENKKMEPSTNWLNTSIKQMISKEKNLNWFLIVPQKELVRTIGPRKEEPKRDVDKTNRRT